MALVVPQEQTFRHEVNIFNADTQQHVSSCVIPTKVTYLLWTSKHLGQETTSLKQSQMILAGLQDGKIAVIKVKGVHTVRTEVLCMLSFHTTPVMYI